MIFNKIILLFCLLAACSGNNNNTGSAPSGNGSHFSCIIDGQPVSGDGAIDPMHIYNIGTINEVDEGKELLFYLNDAKSDQSISDFTHALRFSIPCKTGTASFGHEENGWGIQVDIKPDKDHQATYLSDSFTVNVTSITSTDATGTFSGKFDLREGAFSANYKKHIDVTDGKFEVPMKK